MQCDLEIAENIRHDAWIIRESLIGTYSTAGDISRARKTVYNACNALADIILYAKRPDRTTQWNIETFRRETKITLDAQKVLDILKRHNLED